MRVQRKYTDDLVKWKDKKNRKPLLLFGARQVGKTYLIKEFGNKYFKNIIEVNFEKNVILCESFKNDLEPKEIIKLLENYFEVKINKDDTLIFFDEIQKCPAALTSLKYFCEDAPEYYVIGAGSLLGVHVNLGDYSFPVGKVQMMTIYPLSFDEFLFNTSNENLLNEIKTCFDSNKKMNDALHKKALSLYYNYLSLGGMPDVVNNYILTNSIISSIELKSDIISSYREDINTYASEENRNLIISAFDSIPVQLSKDNKKFQYKLIKKGGTSKIFGDSIDWLVNSGITLKCIKANSGVPIKSYEELDSFKLYMNDVGLLTSLLKFPIYMINNPDIISDLKIGILAENYVASSLKFNGFDLHYWQSGTSEVDFLLQSNKGFIIPVEVKASDNTKSRSLNVYIQKNNPKYSIRISSKNFGFVNGIKSVPLYATFCITEDSLDI